MTNIEFINALEKQLDDMASDYKALGSKREQLAMDMNKIRFLIDKLKEEDNNNG